jgi:hypothetical protein
MPDGHAVHDLDAGLRSIASALAAEAPAATESLPALPVVVRPAGPSRRRAVATPITQDPPQERHVRMVDSLAGGDPSQAIVRCQLAAIRPPKCAIQRSRSSKTRIPPCLPAARCWARARWNRAVRVSTTPAGVMPP